MSQYKWLRDCTVHSLWVLEMNSPVELPDPINNSLAKIKLDPQKYVLRLIKSLVQGKVQEKVGDHLDRALEERSARRGSAALNKAYEQSVADSKQIEASSISRLTNGLRDLGNLSGEPVLKVRLNAVAHQVQAKYNAGQLSYTDAVDMVSKANKLAAKRAQAKAIGLTGKGDYTWRDYTRALAEGIGGGLGGLAGNQLGGKTGMAVGASLGSTIGGDIAKMVGLGDYTVGVNSLTKSGFKIAPGMPVPEFGGGNSSTTIRHREYVGDIVATGSSAFSVKSYVINPGNALLFPWLSVIAQNYSQYEFKGLVAQFVSTTSDVTAGGGLGTVIMGTNYDVLQNAYASKQVMENAQYTVSARPSISMIHTFECDPKLRPMKTMFIRDLSSSSSVSQDARFSDLGKFQVAQVGMPGAFTAGTVLGELWLSYEVVLSKADIADPFLQILGRGDAFLFSAAARATISDVNVFGTVDRPITTGTLGGAITNINTYTFPSGLSGTRFMVHATWLGTPAVATTVFSLIGTNVTVLSAVSYPAVAGGDTTDRVGIFGVVSVNSNVADIAFLHSGTIIPTACTQCILYVWPVSSSIPFF